MTEIVQIDVQDHIAHVTLNRPEKLNALSPEMFEAIIDAGEQLRTNGYARVIVISGSGDGFCAGLDVSSFAGMAAGAQSGETSFTKLVPRTHGIANTVQQVALTWHQQPVPVIAAIHGACFGGGFQIALGADMRYARADARFSIRELKWGLIPDMSGTQLIQGLAREDVIRELTYTAREFSGQEAAEYGLVTRLCEDPLEEAMRVAADIAGKNPTAIEAIKQVMNDAPYRSLEAGLMDESVAQEAVQSDPNFREALTAAMAKRKPDYKNAR